MLFGFITPDVCTGEDAFVCALDRDIIYNLYAQIK